MKCKFHRPTLGTHLVFSFFFFFFLNPKQKHFGPKDREIKHEDHEV